MLESKSNCYTVQSSTKGPYFAGAPAGYSQRSSCHLDRPIVPVAHPRCSLRVIDLAKPRSSTAVASRMGQSPLANLQGTSVSFSAEHPRSPLYELQESAARNNPLSL